MVLGMTSPSVVTNTTQFAGLNGGSVMLSPAQLADLKGRLQGPVLHPGDAGWDEAVLLWNGMQSRAPALVVQPVSAADVSGVVRFAREHALLLSIKGGGHNIAGTALVERGLALDLSRLREVRVDKERKLVHAGGGCLLQDVDRATQEHGLATALGFVSEVGVAGLTLGGGLGYLTRRFGWTVDNLEEVEIVTADGSVRRASRDEHADLFWALRGGGGNLGVVTRFTLRVHEVGPTVYGGLIAWPFARAAEVLKTYQRLTRAAPRELSVWSISLRAPGAPFVPEAWHGERLCAMAVCYSGPLAETSSVLAPIRALGEPVFDLLREQPYVELQSYLDCTEPKGNHYYWKTEFAAELSDELLATWQALAADCPIPEGQLGILHLGGRLNELEPDDGAVGNRDARFALGALGAWEPDEPQAELFRTWVRSAWQRIRPFSTGGNYINFQTADEDGARIRAAYGKNFTRLEEVKKAYDPHNLFRANRNIAV
jgi:FAD/FMN-containing dehydrogenase